MEWAIVRAFFDIVAILMAVVIVIACVSAITEEAWSELWPSLLIGALCFGALIVLEKWYPSPHTTPFMRALVNLF
jgi:uncharacterized membrane protein YedE/YeeE